MGAQGGDDDDIISGINVTPLVDIVLVILIIFMVTATDIVKSQIGVELPRAASGQAEVSSTLTFLVARDGAWSLDGEPIADAQMAAAIKRAVASGTTRAVIAADKEVDYGRVIELIDTVKLNGVEKFALNIQRRPRPSAERAE